MNTTWIKACLVHGSAHTQLLLCDWAYLCVQLNTWCVTMKRCLRTTTCTHMHIHATSKTRSHRAAPLPPREIEMQRELRSPMAAWSGKIVRRSGPESIALTSSRPRGVGESNTVATHRTSRTSACASPGGLRHTSAPTRTRAAYTAHEMAPGPIGDRYRPRPPVYAPRSRSDLSESETNANETRIYPICPPPRTRPRKVERLSPGTC
jgi:hypothetical protein